MHKTDNLQGLDEARKSLKNAMRNLYAIKGRGRTDMDGLLAEGEAIIRAIDQTSETLRQEVADV